MATSPDSSPSPASRRGLRYSLRALLIVVTLACIGVWYWYRVPYVQEYIHPAIEGKVPPWWAEAPPRAAREEQRFRRTLWGEPVREGRTDSFDATGRRIREEYFRENQHHGKSISWHANGNVCARGQYQMGRLNGLWEQFDEDERPTYQMRYENGRPHGEWVVYADGKQSRTYRFENGEAKEVNGQPLDDPLGRAARLGEIDDEDIQEAMFVYPSWSVWFREIPVWDFVTWASEQHKVNVIMDRRLFRRMNLDSATISLDLDSISLGGLLILALEPLDLAATYRFGTIWITTKEDAASWVDRTKVATLLDHPPGMTIDLQRAEMARFLDKPAEFDFVDTPVDDVGRFITQFFHPIELTWEGAESDRPINSNLRGISMRDALGALCDQHDLRIRWTQGTTLVVEPQEEERPGSK